MKRLLISVGIVAVLASLIVGVFHWKKNTPQSIGSVSNTSEYHSTSTGYLGATLGRLIKTGAGTFGSVVISGANTGVMDFYDATTTNINLRTNQAPTNTIYLGTIVTSQAAGTYTFDAFFVNGLLVERTGLSATSTITYR